MKVGIFMFNDGWDIDYQKWDDYASAVTVAMQQNLETQIINDTMQIAQKYITNINEDRLVEILKNDRASYNKGRKDAEFQIAHSDYLEHRGNYYVVCSECGKLILGRPNNYVNCVYCGAVVPEPESLCID